MLDGRPRCSGAKRLTNSQAAGEIGREKDGAGEFAWNGARDCAARGRGVETRLQHETFSASLREVVTRKLAGVGSVLGLCKKIGGDPAGVAAFSENDRFRGAGGKIDGAVAGDELLGGGDVSVARAEDFFDTRN